MKKTEEMIKSEEIFELKLTNYEHKLGLWIGKVERYITNDSLKKQELELLNKRFFFYKNELIPALKETLELDKKHITLSLINPDRENFKPIKIEIKNHQMLIDQFIKRVDVLHKELETLL